MFWLIETQQQLEGVYPQGDVFVELVLLSERTHPKLNDVCCIYLRPINSSKGFTIAINHYEAQKVDKLQVANLLARYDRVFVRDKKQYLYFFDAANVYDINFIQHIKHDVDTTAHTTLMRRYHDDPQINTIIPISKHHQKCEALYEVCRNVIQRDLPQHFQFYNQDATQVFWSIETQGIRIVDQDNLHSGNPIFSIREDRIYTHYNLYTNTTRPSNAFNGVNFAALNKEDGTRASIVPENDILVEIDINGYHPSLIAQLVDYDLGQGDVYEHFSQILQVDRAQAKDLVFKQLYGGVYSQYRDIDFFQRVQKYIDELWATYQHKGYVLCPISQYKLDSTNVEGATKQKLFNYFIQNLETSTNVRILQEIGELLTPRARLVLYVYDAFVFDIGKEQVKTLESIERIFTQNKLKTKISYGKNYNSLRRL